MKKIKLVEVEKNKYRVVADIKTEVNVYVYLNKRLYNVWDEDEALRQLINAARLPGVFKHVLGMPDIHAGFGLPIGGVMASKEEGVVSAGAVGMDINCGVRLLSTKIHKNDVNKAKLADLIAAIEKRVPTGIGKQSRLSGLYKKHFQEIVEGGVAELIRLGYGKKEDLRAIEEGGGISPADLSRVSNKAIERGNQLATLGGGNHFLEIGVVDEILDKKLAEKFGLQKGNLTVMIHTGSRGFGHQICTDYTKVMVNAASHYGITLPSKGLACVPIFSREGQDYLSAMGCAVNFAFANRHLISCEVMEAFEEVFGGSVSELGISIVYDVAHNIAKFEKHFGKRLLVHRKGATRALPPGHPQNPEKFVKTGHPAIVPGSMGTPSYVIAATTEIFQTFNSVNHGAGRVMSRKAAKQNITQNEMKSMMKGIIINKNPKKLLDEAPVAYKNVDDVVNTLAEIGLTKKVVRIQPLAVIKGED